MNYSTLMQLKEEFAGYCRTFYSENDADQRNVLLKEEHTYNVCSHIARIAAEEWGSREAAVTAEIIALFHDVGRFEQYRRYRTFLDSQSVNHAALGVDVINSVGFLDGLPEKERRLIIGAVGLHNVYAIPEHVDPDLLSFLRLIRDADKLDIWRVFIDLFNTPAQKRASAACLGLPDTGKITGSLIDYILREEMIALSYVNSVDDFKLLQLSWVFDLNFATSFRILHERNYVFRLAATLPDDPLLVGALDLLQTYINRRCTTGMS